MTSTHKNILLIIADDLGKLVGTYGCKSVSTPQIDKFATEGSRFDLAFASTASCSGSRSVIHSGLHTHENGMWGIQMQNCHFQCWEHIDTGVKLFGEAGYLTGNVAKVHVGPKSVFPWHVREVTGSRDSWYLAGRCEAFMEQAKAENKPFFLTAAFHDPHRDRSRAGFANDRTYSPEVDVLDIPLDQVEIPHWYTDTPESRQEFVDYYKAIHRFDQGVGWILERLEKLGLAENTLVVVTSDNGPPFVNSKTTLYDAGCCLPFIVRSPQAEHRGIANPNLVSYVDILPTFLDWAGLPMDLKTNDQSPKRLGRSILPILDRADVAPESEWQHHIFLSHTYHQRDQYWPTRAIRGRRYKYHRNVAWQLPFAFATDLYLSISFEGIRNLPKPVKVGKRLLKDYIHRPAEELFDMEMDPDEVNNLAEDPKYADIKKELREKLEAWQYGTDDWWLYRDGQSWKQVNLWCLDEVELPDQWDMDAENPGIKDRTDIGMVKMGNGVPDKDD